jgi:hypothetical protein
MVVSTDDIYIRSFTVTYSLLCFSSSFSPFLRVGILFTHTDNDCLACEEERNRGNMLDLSVICDSGERESKEEREREVKEESKEEGKKGRKGRRNKRSRVG